MKRRSLLMLCLLLLASRGLYAQDTEGTVEKGPRANVFKLNTLPLLFGSFNVSYERRISPYLAGAITATAYPKRLTLSEGDTSSTYAITADFKIYLKGESLRGFYIAPYLKYRLRRNNAREGDGFFLFASPDREYEAWVGYGVGTSFGYQLVSAKGLTLDSFLGIGHYFHQHLKNETSYTKDQIQHRKPWQYDLRLGASIGYAF
jgi:hypothetical protein